MPLKTSYFNKGIFINNIKRFWLITFAYTFSMFIFIMGYLNSLTRQVSRTTEIEILNNLGKRIFDTSDLMMVFFGLFPIVAALAVFSYMHFQKNTTMVHSLPVTRSTLFVTNYLSGLFIVSFPLLINSLILVVAEAIAGLPDITYTWMWLGINLVLTLLFYNFAVFAGMFTGHIGAQAIFFYILNFLALFLERVIVSIFGNFLFGYISNDSLSVFKAWSPLDYLNTFYRDFQNDRGKLLVLVGYFIAGIIFLVSSYYLYKKRHMEVATDVISFSFVKPIFKYSVAFCSAALIGNIIISILDINQNLAAHIITYLIGGFVGYFAAEMLMQKTFRVFKAYKGYLVFALVLSLLLCSIDFDLYGYERKIPQDSKVEIIGVSTSSDPLMRVAVKPEDYNPEKHGYLIPTQDYRGKSTGFYNDSSEVLSEEQVQWLRESLPGVFDNREVITKARQIHSYIVKNESLFKENEKLRRNDAYGQNADSFQSRNLYFLYKLEDGSLLERQYSLLTYEGNTELDNLLREYISLPGVRERYEPILVTNADDIYAIWVSFETKDGHYQDFEITNNIQDFLDVYKSEFIAEDPLKSMYKESEEYDYDVNIRIEFKDELLNRNGVHYKELYKGFSNTLNYLVEKGVFELENLMPREIYRKDIPAAEAVYK